jgi:hypothetical protein
MRRVGIKCRGFHYVTNPPYAGRVDSAPVTESKRPQEVPSHGLRDGAGLPAEAPGAMRFTVKHIGNYLRADLYERETAEETQQFLHAVAEEATKAAVDRVLISVHASRPIFRVQSLGLPEFFKTAAARPAHRIAIVADSYEGRLAQQYVVTVARQRGLNVRSFRSDAAAADWLQSR